MSKYSKPTGGGRPKIIRKGNRTVHTGLSRFMPSFMKKINKNALLAGVLAGILLLAGIMSFTFNKKTDDQASVQVATEQVEIIETAPLMSATISFKEGIAEYRTDGIWDKTPVDLELLPGMSVRTTGAASRAEILLGDGSVVRLDANTEVSLETLTLTRVIIDQKSGHTYSRVTSGDARYFAVTTKHAQFQASDASMRVITSGDEESAEVYYGGLQETSTTLKAIKGEKLVIKDYRDQQRNSHVFNLDINEVKKDSFMTWNKQKDALSTVFKDKLGYLSDFEGPLIEIINPKEGTTLEIDAAIDPNQPHQIKISGSTEPGSKLTVVFKSGPAETPETLEVALKSDGTFETALIDTALGSSIYEFTATDKIGNKTIRTVSFTVRAKATTFEQGIALTIDTESDPDNIELQWALVGLTAPDGIKIVYGTDEDPSLPDDLQDSVDDGSSATIDKSTLSAGNTYYFRVCRYIDSQTDCDVYSNPVSFEYPTL